VIVPHVTDMRSLNHAHRDVPPKGAIPEFSRPEMPYVDTCPSLPRWIAEHEDFRALASPRLSDVMIFPSMAHEVHVVATTKFTRMCLA
jgi:hypothetical protein